MDYIKITSNRFVSVILILLLGGFVSPVFAGHEASLSGSDFEIDDDANLAVDEDPNPMTGRNSLDWDNVDQIRTIDQPSGTGDDAFGQGTKENSCVVRHNLR